MATSRRRADTLESTVVEGGNPTAEDAQRASAIAGEVSEQSAPTLSTAANDPATPETQAEPSEADAAVAAEARQLSEELGAVTDAALALGATTSSRPATEPAQLGRTRKRLSNTERTQLNRTRLERGKQLLERRAVGVPHMTQAVEVSHRSVSDLFLRSYPVVDNAFATLFRSGGMLLGRTAANDVSDQASKLVDELATVSTTSYDLARELIEAARKNAGGVNADQIKLTYVPSIETRTVIARSPQALKLLKAFESMDLALKEHDKLVWAGIRSTADLDAEFVSMRKRVTAVVILMMRTLTAMNRKMREYYAPAAPTEAA